MLRSADGWVSRRIAEELHWLIGQPGVALPRGLSRLLAVARRSRGGQAESLWAHYRERGGTHSRGADAIAAKAHKELDPPRKRVVSAVDSDGRRVPVKRPDLAPAGEADERIRTADPFITSEQSERGKPL